MRTRGIHERPAKFATSVFGANDFRATAAELDCWRVVNRVIWRDHQSPNMSHVSVLQCVAVCRSVMHCAVVCLELPHQRLVNHQI